MGKWGEKWENGEKMCTRSLQTVSLRVGKRHIIVADQVRQ
jgi:hypothetical protein